jgi:Uncharacterized protein conserved in cyanobacteria
MTAVPRGSFMSLEEYFQLGERDPAKRYEFIDGQVTLLPRDTPNQSTIDANISQILLDALQGRPCLVFDEHTRVRLSAARYVYADIAVSCHPRDRGRVTSLDSPCLVGEILTPETAARDRNEKFIAYRDHMSIQEYMLVSSERPQVEVFCRERKNHWSYHIYEERDTVELSRLMIRFAVSALYSNVTFPTHRR